MSRRTKILNSRWFTYILLCRDDTYYIGITNNLNLRISKHDQGIAAHYTSFRRPVRLVYSEGFPNKSEARKREIQLKGWSRKKKKLLIERKLF